MAYLAVNEDGCEEIFLTKPVRDWHPYGYWDDNFSSIPLPKGTIKKLINQELTWEDEPYELK